jgi:predicted NUDIX family NTP pyrophosphohydrolase
MGGPPGDGALAAPTTSIAAGPGRPRPAAKAACGIQAADPEVDRAGWPEVDRAGWPEVDRAGWPEVDRAGWPELDRAGWPELGRAR